MATTASPPPPAVPAVLAGGDALYEVVNGEVVEKSLGAFEAELASLLVCLLGSFARTNRLGKVVGEALFRLNPATNLQRRPDVAFVSDARWPFNRRAPREAAWDVIPDLAIEVVSPTNTADEVVAKLGEYFQAGVIRVWVVYPSVSQVDVYESPASNRILVVGDVLDGAPVLPGFTLPLATLFADDPA